MGKYVLTILCIIVLSCSMVFADEIDDYLNKGLKYYSNGEYAEAIGEWEKVLGIDPENQKALDYIKDAEKKIKERKEAEKKKKEEKELKILRNGRKLYKNKQPHKAIELWTKIPEDSKYYEEAQEFINFAENKIKEEQAIEAPNKKYYQTGGFHYFNEDYKKAIKEWSKIPKTSGYYKNAQEDINTAKQELYGIEEARKKKDEGEIPPLNGWRLAGELVVGGVAGAVIGVPGAFAGGLIGALLPKTSLRTKKIGALFGYYAFYVVGSSLGVNGIGNSGNETGSFGITLAGSFAGAGISIITLFSVREFEDLADLAVMDNVGLIIVASGPVICSMIGFNITRRYDDDYWAGLINYTQGELCFAMPTVSFYANPHDKKDITQSMDLVRVRF